MTGLIVTAFYITGIAAACHAVLMTRTATGAVAWAVCLVTMPFVAVPAYAVFGRNKFEGLAEAFAEGRREIQAVLKNFHHEQEPWEVASDATPSWYQAVQKLTDFSVVRGNRAQLLIDGDATFSSILDGIAEAEDYVLLQFYMIHDDNIGRRIKAALIDRANNGVEVIVLYDEVGSTGLPDAYVDELEESGVKVSAFRTTRGIGNQFQLNFRNHRKIVVVDGKVAWLGGLNIGDEYLGHDPDFSPWRDTHVRIEGPAVMQAQLTILGDWYWATRKVPELNWEPQAADNGNQQMIVVPTAPTGRLENASLIFVAAINSARKRLWLSAPYFVPDEAATKALQLAALRGVDVRIITTGKGDSLPVYLAAFYYIHLLRGLGIRFHAYKPGFLHGKVMLMDDELSMVATHNFDNRSFRLNFEVAAFIEDKKFAAEVEKMFVKDFEHSEEIDAELWDERPIWWRIGVQLARLASPVL